ncbi:MAG: hypothetical protein HY699_11475 [Deltaproteobacteria bacterium]|nr:hypothetical protein [Deltaproteobacteria bacterium]
MNLIWRLFIVLAMCAATTGCAELALKQKERQMERVARDWTMTIRASQVVPVYPLSQDIQVGDVYLVNRTVAAQSKRYRERGFMPTDLLITRLDVGDFGPFYRTREHRIAGEPLVLPGAWRDLPGPQGPWGRFPKAGFPSYTFTVSNSGGLSVAVPVSAVPVALSVTGAATATGSITIADAVTYGMDASSVYAVLLDTKERGLLNHAVPPEKSLWYLRVITRVFAAKSFDVVLNATSTLGGGVDAGAPQPVADAGGHLETGQTVTQINEQLGTVGRLLDTTGLPLPGGSLRATFAGGRTIGFKETFVEPIVVGYHGFDVAIDAQGNLGPIIPTFQVLEDDAAPPQPTGLTDQDSAYLAMLALLRKTARTSEGDAALVTATLILAAKRGAFEAKYTEMLGQRRTDPVGAWVAVTAADATTVGARNRLTGLVSGAIREKEIGE